MDHDKIVNKRAQRIARDHGCSVADVNAALDHHPIELDRDTFLKRTLAMELVELDELQAAFRDKALVDRDTSAGVLLIKVAERRATLLGLNPPIGHAVRVIQPPPAHQTSTGRLRGILDNVLHITPRERELLNREEDEGSTPEIRAELDRLRAERGKPQVSGPDDLD